MPTSPRIPVRTLGLPLAGALAGSEPLADLLKRVGESKQRFEAIAGLLPPTLRAAVRPGPLDDTSWALLAANAAAAAKLRQMLPSLQQALAERGWPAPVLQVRIAPRC